MILYFEHFSWQKFDKEVGGNSQTVLLVRAGRGHRRLKSMMRVYIDVPIYADMCIYSFNW